jgi:hypothetical protein
MGGETYVRTDVILVVNMNIIALRDVKPHKTNIPKEPAASIYHENKRPGSYKMLVLFYYTFISQKIGIFQHMSD